MMNITERATSTTNITELATVIKNIAALKSEYKAVQAYLYILNGLTKMYKKE